jgi:hypothetical protein
MKENNHKQKNTRTLEMNRATGGNAPMTTKPAPDRMTDAQPMSLSKFACCIDTAKKIDTDVGGAMINGMSVRNDDAMLPMAHVTVVATMDAVSS